MIELLVRMDEKTFEALRTAIQVRILSGAAGGLVDAFANRFVERVEAGAVSHDFVMRRDPT